MLACAVSAALAAAAAPVPIAVVACNRGESLRRLLRSVAASDGAAALHTTVYHNCGDPGVAAAAAEAGVAQHPHTGGQHASVLDRITYHVRYALESSFQNTSADAVVVLEDDLEVSSGFYGFLVGLLPELLRDKTLLCASLWNDHGQRAHAVDTTAVRRTDFFPGLGWMVTRGTWESVLRGAWPESGVWDVHIRQSSRPGGPLHGRHQCLYPEVSRVRHAPSGEGGAGIDLVDAATLIDGTAFMGQRPEPALPDVLGSALAMDAWVVSTLAAAEWPHGLDAVRPSARSTPLAFVFNEMDDWYPMAEYFSLWPRMGMPYLRSSYDGVLPLRWYGRRLMLVGDGGKYAVYSRGAKKMREWWFDRRGGTRYRAGRDGEDCHTVCARIGARCSAEWASANRCSRVISVAGPGRLPAGCGVVTSGFGGAGAGALPAIVDGRGVVSKHARSSCGAAVGGVTRICPCADKSAARRCDADSQYVASYSQLAAKGADLLEAGDAASAEPCLREAAEGSGSEGAVLLWAAALQALGRFEEAVALYARAGDSAEALHGHAASLDSLGEHVKAAAVWGRAWRRWRSAFAANRRGVSLARAERLHDAEIAFAECQSAVTLRRHLGICAGNRIAALRQLDRDDDALAAAVALAAGGTSDLPSDAALEVADALAEGGRSLNLAFTNRSLDFYDAAGGAPTVRSRAARAMMEVGLRDESLRLHALATAGGGDDPEVLYNSGDALLAVGRTSDALRQLQRCADLLTRGLRADDDLATRRLLSDAYTRVAAAELRLGRAERAVRAAAAAVWCTPVPSMHTKWNPYLLLSQAFLAAGRPLAHSLAAMRASGAKDGWDTWVRSMWDVVAESGAEEVAAAVAAAALPHRRLPRKFYAAVSGASCDSSCTCTLYSDSSPIREPTADVTAAAAACAAVSGGEAGGHVEGGIHGPPSGLQVTTPSGGRMQCASGSERPNAVIVYLCCGDEEEYFELRRSLFLLARNMLRAFPHPVVVFHEGFGARREHDLASNFLRGLNTRSSELLRFVRLTFRLPEHIHADQVPDRVLWYGLGYRHMCRFFSGEVFWHPAVQGYRWLLRLDADSYFYAPVLQDPVAEAQRCGVKYMTAGAFRDNGVYVAGLLGETERHFGDALGSLSEARRRISARNRALAPSGHWDRICYATHFTVVDLTWAAGDEYRSYFDALDAAGGFYTTRWGDACVQYLAAAALLRDDEVGILKGIPYVHQTQIMAIDQYWGHRHFFAEAPGNLPP